MLDNLTVAVKISFIKFKVKENFLESYSFVGLKGESNTN
jgi:hypothetical protein